MKIVQLCLECASMNAIIVDGSLFLQLLRNIFTIFPL